MIKIWRKRVIINNSFTFTFIAFFQLNCTILLVIIYLARCDSYPVVWQTLEQYSEYLQTTLKIVMRMRMIMVMMMRRKMVRIVMMIFNSTILLVIVYLARCDSYRVVWETP